VRARLSLALSIVAGAFLVQAATADPVGPHVEFVPFGGVTLFDGDLQVGGRSLRDDLYMGGRLGYQLHPLWAVEVAGGFTPTAQIGSGGTDVDFYHASGNLMFTPWPGPHGGPFLFAGAGTSQVKPGGGSGVNKGDIEVGGGLRFWLTDALGLRLEMRQVYYKWDDPANGEQKLNHVIAGGGLVFAFGARGRDTDGDGVPDRKDHCPATPKGARVDATGCPKDSDGDGVLDGLDRCENTAKGCTVDKSGCPSDADQDGVCDGIDQCADTPKGATVDAKGCPSDSDGDGVWDGIDQCADTPKGATVDAKGCPSDSDGDGVWDGLDKCPDTSAGLKVDRDGCPIEYIEKETEMLDTGMIRLQDVNFETAKATLLPESLPVLDVVGAILKKWPELKIEIGGHTDARGSNAANQKLSEARAQSVLSYLTQKYPELKAEQFSAKGYGESKPVAPNTTPLNMAKNRRVEFVVMNKDVLKRETERRRLLQKGESAPADTTKKEAAPADTTGKP
jgi:outer membrane protein OmpA-like peptidoglycan-associated protein